MLLCISLQYPAWAILDTVTMVKLTDFLHSVSVTKRSALWCKLSASSLVTVYSLCENFISQIFTMLSALSMSMSICAPFLPSALGPTRHANTLVTTPLMPRAVLIWRICRKHRRSKAKPTQADRRNHNLSDFVCKGTKQFFIKCRNL